MEILNKFPEFYLKNEGMVSVEGNHFYRLTGEKTVVVDKEFFEYLFDRSLLLEIISNNYGKHNIQEIFEKSKLSYNL